MDMLRSSIIGKDFVNYRKSTIQTERLRFSGRVRGQGIGNVPVVVDSVDTELSKILSKQEGRYTMYGREFVFHVDDKLSDVLKALKIAIIQKDKEEIVKSNSLHLGLEDGTIPELNSELGKLYKQYRNDDDKILYLLVTKENTMYGYITSILKYIYDKCYNLLSRN